MNLKQYNEIVKFRSLSYSDEQDLLLMFLEEELKNLKFHTYFDLYGNLIAERGKGIKPLIIAHADINQRREETPTLLRVNDYLIGFHEGEQIGIGHDDKAGIYFALNFAKETRQPLMIIFSKDEEVGCIGTDLLDVDFNNITLAVQLDRRGASDISDFTNGVETVSKQFKDLCKPYLKEHGYKFTRTIYTDVGQLKKEHKVNFCCVNISTGYYNEHTDQEFLKISEFQNASIFAGKLLFNLGDTVQRHEYIKPIEIPFNTRFQRKQLSWSAYEDDYKRYSKHYLNNDVNFKL